ncbi:MAG: gliding motility-associated C-terminal domain-containing protein [Bacteroidales bacterium]|nr:gliding motility-associated C-terminal domain-containing protein [Bacteroidales bacterium]
MSDLPGNTITCAGSKFAFDVYFKGSGEWILQDTLFMYDSTDWKAIMYDFVEPFDPNPLLIHENGTLRTNDNTIITRGLITVSNNQRALYMHSAHVYCAGPWSLSGENIDFDAANSYIYMMGDMSNFAGDVITYHDIDLQIPTYSLSNTDIRTVMRKVHFLGSGDVSGKFTPGIEGSFTIDTLIFEGYIDPMMGPIPCTVEGPEFIMHYAEVNVVDGHFNQRGGIYHRVVFNGFVPVNEFYGLNNVCDTVQFQGESPVKGIFSGNNIVNNLLYYKTTGHLSTWSPFESTINHAVFKGDGTIGGSNNFDWLTFSNGHLYEIQTDSLEQPGSYYTNTNVQTVNQFEVDGDGCLEGFTTIMSNHKYTAAILNYTGPTLYTEYLVIRDLKNIGPNTIYVDKGIDLNNTDGFIFTNLHDPRVLYWVGGEGDWNDSEHWSLVSGSTPGDQCPPTPKDDIFFNLQSGFADTGMIVNVNMKHAWCNDMIWETGINLPILSGPDTNFFHSWGSVILDTSMQYLFFGEFHFESEDDPDDDWETVKIDYSLDFGEDGIFEYDWFFNKVYFYGKGGKWEVDSSFTNYYDTTYLLAGDLKLTQDTLRLLNFSAMDTLPKGLFLLDSSMLEVHQYQADAYVWHAFMMDSITFLDPGRSLIRAMGDISPPMGAPPGFCNIRTYGGEVDYFNIEFSTEEVRGIKSMLKSESKCNYHLVDYWISFGEGVGNGTIDTLTFKEGADGCRYQDVYEIDFVMAYGWMDTLMDSHVIDTAIFFDDGALQGYLNIGYLQADKYMSMLYRNKIDTAILYGNADILGHNTFSQLVLSPEKKYFFQHEIYNNPYLWDTTIIIDDWVVNGYCDGPIRLQSDSIGTQAKILYKAQNPTHPEFTMKYSSIRDIRMLEYENKQYIAENSVDLGNNTNIEFEESTEGDIYYWIGGSGDWGDWSHWSHSSGGLPIADECVPKELTTVIFDDNSFYNPNDTVFVDVLNAYCKSMYWKQSTDYNPYFIGPDTSVLYIYGSLELKENMSYQYLGEIFFDQYEEPGDIADTISSRGNIFLNHIYFQGINDVVYLGDDLEMFMDPANQIFMSVYHEHGTLVLNGQHMTAGGYFSYYKNNRTLNMENSIASVRFDFDRCWEINGTNFQLEAYNSTLYNESFMGTIWTEFGDSFDYWNVVLNMPVDSLANENNLVSYNEIYVNQESGLVVGNFIADTIYLRGRNSAISNNSTTNVIYLDSVNCSINKTHNINECYVNKFGFIRGNNNIKFCQFLAGGVFMGHNVFDTLLLYPGQGDFQNQGNWFYFQADSTQVVIDSLYLRGNQCSNISITSLNPPSLAFIRKDNGFDVSSDYLNIYSVGAVSENDNVDFYAGINSTPLPNPDNPPPGWIFDNAQGYVPGFSGRTDRFCLNEEYVINAANFNGDPFTQYYWEGSQYPGGITYTVNEPGTYQIRVQYFEGCYVEDYIVIEGDYPPIAKLDEGPFCEGDPISVSVSPVNGNYSYHWFNGETTPAIVADMNYNGSISVSVTDTDNNCKDAQNQTIVVKPTPYPQDYLGGDEWIDFGSSITLDAGPGTSYHWTANPEPPNPIQNPDERFITVSGYSNPNPIEYTAFVDLNGCGNEGFKVIGMYPPSKLGVPTAFSPNGDGLNDVLYVEGSGFENMIFQIYNRYGELVFETTDKNLGWDGTVNGSKQEMEVYTYYIKVKYVDGGVSEEKGNITLLR